MMDRGLRKTFDDGSAISKFDKVRGRFSVRIFGC